MAIITGAHTMRISVAFYGVELKGYPGVKKLGPAEVVSDQTTGEAISDVFWFGCAYESKPLFEFSGHNTDPSLVASYTVGVSEWVRDEKGFYVGARLFTTCSTVVSE